MNKLIITLGQIPAKLDAVKYISNRFIGTSIIELANELSDTYDIVLVKWRHNKLDTSAFETIEVDEVMDYYNKIKQMVSSRQYHGVILGAAVANLMPIRSYKGKFPSHSYTDSDIIQIDFKLCPRIINMVKAWNPTINLIGFKTSTNSWLEARNLQQKSKADLIIWNNPNNINNIICYYKTEFRESMTRDGMADAMRTVLDNNKKYKLTEGILMDTTNIDAQLYLKFIEINKYIIDENGHGACLLSNKNGDVMVSSRYQKDIPVSIDNPKATQSLPQLQYMHDTLNHKYCIHTHFEPRLNTKFAYIPTDYQVPNMEPTGHFKEHVSLVQDGVEVCIVNSENAGYFVSSNNFVDILRMYSDRIWNNYTPPNRYVREHRKSENNKVWVGGANLVDIQSNLDPYYSDEPIYLNNLTEVELKNSLPVVGMKVLDLICKGAHTIHANIPKQYKTHRLEECIDGGNSLEMSTVRNGIVAHTLVREVTKDKDMFERDLNVIHTYEAIYLEHVYDRYRKQFTFEITKETKNNYHITMHKINK